MENAAEALQIAFGVLLFVVALTLSISCFSQATTAVDSIISLRDTHTEYKTVNPSNGLTRIVGAETVVPTMYSAYSNNIEIYFKIKNVDGTTTSMPIYYKTDPNNNENRVIDSDTSTPVTIDYIDLKKENYASSELAKKHLEMILAGKDYNDSAMVDKYEKQFIYDEGFYNYIKDKKFEESLGEYYQGSDSATASSSTQIKKRVITYTLIN